MIKAYRVELTDIGYIGTFECLIGEKTPKGSEEEKIEIKSPKVYEGCLYCPKVDLLVNELPKIKKGREIHKLTWEETENGETLKSLSSLTEDERKEY